MVEGYFLKMLNPISFQGIGTWYLQVWFRILLHCLACKLLKVEVELKVSQSQIWGKHHTCKDLISAR